MLKRVKEITYEPQLLPPGAEEKLAATATASKMACAVIVVT